MSIECFHTIGSWITPKTQSVYLGSSPFKHKLLLFDSAIFTAHFWWGMRVWACIMGGSYHLTQHVGQLESINSLFNDLLGI